MTKEGRTQYVRDTSDNQFFANLGIDVEPKFIAQTDWLAEVNNKNGNLFEAIH